MISDPDFQRVSSALGFISNDGIVQLEPSFGYTLYLSKNATGAAAELNADPLAAIRSCAQVASSVVPSDFLIDQTSFLGPWRRFDQQHGYKQIPASGILTPVVEQYMVESYQKQGFYNSTYIP
jgi:hypothetical protein